MGTQAAAARQVGVPDVSTVVVTSTITGLAADSWFGTRAGAHAPRRGTAVALILLGAMVAALLLRWEPWPAVALGRSRHERCHVPRGSVITTYDQIDPPTRLLMGPGPINADPRVLRAMSAAMVGQYDPAMTEYLRQTQELYREVFATSNDATLLVDGTSRAGIEAVFVSLLEPGDRVLVPIFGRFGHLLVEIAARAGAEVHTIEIRVGHGLHRRADRAGADRDQAQDARARARRHLDHDVPATR